MIHTYIGPTVIKTSQNTNATSAIPMMALTQAGDDCCKCDCDNAVPDKQPPKRKVKKEHKPGGYKIYKKLAMFVCVPSIVLLALNVFVLNAEEEAAPEFLPYSYMCQRNKRFPWGDGTKTLFHNPDKNALKDRYQ